MPEARRAEWAKRVWGAGLLPVDRSALVVEVSQELQRSLGLSRASSLGWRGS